MRSHRSFFPTLRIFLIAFLVSFFVLGVSLSLQWLVYDDWLHQTGSLHVVGTSIAAVVTFAFVLHWQRTQQERQREMLRRFEMIAHMNDRIRNALQAIACVTYLSEPEATENVRQAVSTIDEALRGVLADVASPPRSPQSKANDTSAATVRKSA